MAASSFNGREEALKISNAAGSITRALKAIPLVASMKGSENL